MYETAATWTITGPDGTSVIFNDGVSGLYLQAVTGFDSPNVRQNIADLPESDGAVAGSSYYSSRPVTLTGKIVASSAAQRNTTVVNLQRAFRGLRGDVTLKSTPQGLPAMQATARLDNLRVTGGYVKDFQIALVCPDPRVFSQTLNTTSAQGVTATPGATFPWSWPVSFGGGSGALLTVNPTNAGNFTAPPTIRVVGPIIDPQVTNYTAGQSLYLDGLTLAAGEYVTLDFAARTAVKSDGSNVYSKVRFPGTSWFYLDPGSSTVQLWGTSAAAGTEIDVWWRDSWA